MEANEKCIEIYWRVNSVLQRKQRTNGLDVVSMGFLLRPKKNVIIDFTSFYGDVDPKCIRWQNDEREKKKKHKKSFSFFVS